MKKMLIVALSLFVSVQAMAMSATSASSSWKEIFADRDLIVVAPYSNELGPNGIFNACATATEIKSLSPQKVCVEERQVPSTGNSDVDYPPQYECVRYEQRVMSMARKGMKDGCVEYGMETIGDSDYWTCKKSGKVAYEVNLTQSVDVINGPGENYASVAFTKEYKIPACTQ